MFDSTPDILIVIRPHAIKRDGVYGQFFKSLVRAAEARGLARGATMIEAFEGSEEIIAGLGHQQDGAIILRGVPARLDPQTITDGAGRSLFRPVADRAKVAEYELMEEKADGALFVLPDRVWVGALGETRLRARQAFATPRHQPPPTIDEDSLFAVRANGAVTKSIEQRSPTFAPLAAHLISATATLKPGKGGLVLALTYDEPSFTARAETECKRLVAEFAKKATWLETARVAYEGNTVFVRVAIPPRLLEELPKASDLGAL